MVRDNQDREAPLPASVTEGEAPARGVGLQTALLLLSAAAIVTVVAVLTGRWLFSGRWVAAADSSKAAEVKEPVGVPLFQGWSPPDFVLVLSGQQHGYLMPCGCSWPQKGGLERRWNFLQTLKARHWPVVALDLGDIAQRQGPRDLPNVQGLLKYVYSMKALKLMDYAGTGIGEYDAGLPLRDALDNTILQSDGPPVLCANLHDKDSCFPGEIEVGKLVKVEGTNRTVGVISVVGPSVAKLMNKDPQAQFDPVPQVLPALLEKLEARHPDLRVLLYQGSFKEARACARALPQFQVILCLSEEDEPSSRPEQVGDTLLIGVGHKGKNIGVVGVFVAADTQKPVTLRYQLVTLGVEYVTPDDKVERHPVARLMEQYTRDLKGGKDPEGEYLHKYSQGNHLNQVAVPGVVPTYLGSDKCKKCHEFAYKVWQKSQHAHAYQTLVDARHPSLRQYDGECIVCHVTGFAYKGGFIDAQKTPDLKNVGCESCHGPGSYHAAHPNDKKWRALMNPWSAPPDEDAAAKARRILRMDQACQKCHDPDNDVHWDFQKKWPEIVHDTPGG